MPDFLANILRKLISLSPSFSLAFPPVSLAPSLFYLLYFP